MTHSTPWLVALALSLAACDPAPTPLEYPGPTGYLSDRPSPLAQEPIPPARTLATPKYDVLFVDGALEVAAVFGQLGQEGLFPDDLGYWSQDTLVLALLDAGFGASPDARLGGERYVGVVDGLEVTVDVFGPDRWRFEHDEAAAADLIASVTSTYEVVYLNGHAKQPHLEVLGKPALYPAHRLLVLDICWSYPLYAAAVVAAGDVHVVQAPNRVVTGSVESLLVLLGSLLSPERPSWLSILGELNDRAVDRAATRQHLSDVRLREPEVYGVSGLKD